MTLTIGCDETRETHEVVMTLQEENAGLRRLSHQLAEENAMLHARLRGPAWSRVMELEAPATAQGEPFLRQCPAGQAVSGWFGRVGDVVDTFGLICKPIGPSVLPSARHALRLSTHLERAGRSDGGSDFSRTCREGLHVVELYGRKARVVSSLGARCGRLSGAETATADDTQTDGGPAPEPPAPPWDMGSVGGAQGKRFTQRCPRGWAVVGVAGRHGDFIHRLAARCAPVDAVQTGG